LAVNTRVLYDWDRKGTSYPFGGSGFQKGNQLICWRARIHGVGEIAINYDERNPAIGYRSYLVE